MSPTPHKVEVDLDRKEELILAKQLRACRVQILPKLRSSVSPLPQSSSQSSSPSPHTNQRNLLMAKESSPQSPRPEFNHVTEKDVMNELQMKMHKAAALRTQSHSHQPQSHPQIQQNVLQPPPSPKIVINDLASSNSKQEPVFTVQKLPFLNDIKRLRQSEAHSPVTTLPTPVAPAPAFDSDTVGVSNNVNLETSTISPHLGYLENRPKLTEFPFLDDIRKLRKDNSSSSSTNKIQTNNSISVHEEYKSDYEPTKTNIPAHESPVDRLEPTAREQFENDLYKYNKDKKLEARGPMQIQNQQPKVIQNQSSFSQSPPTKSVRFSTVSPDQEIIAAASPPKQDYVAAVSAFENNVNKIEDDEGESRTAPRTPRTKRTTKFNLKIDEKTNVKRLADQMIPQLNIMQKNFLGLLFFNELSQNIVDDIVAQQLSMMPGSKLASVLSSLDPQASFTSLNMMLNSINEETRLSLLCENFAYLSSEERAGILFTTADDVADVCTTIADFGGKSFKKHLVSKLLENEDAKFVDDVIVDHQRSLQTSKSSRRGQDEPRHFSSADDTYNSAEESLADVIEDEVYQYEYFDFDNK